MIVVTGGAGFIGSAIVWKLNQMNEEDIMIVDSLGSSEKWKNLRNLKYADYLEKDCFLEKIQEGVFDGCDIDCIFHLGACSSTTETDCRYLVQNNFEYTKILAEFSIEHEIRFIYASSAATYGAGELGYSDSEKIMEKLQPLNMYGYSKQMFDNYAYRKKILSKVVGLKYFNVYGPNEYHKGDMRSVVHKAYYQIKETGSVNLFKSYLSGYNDGEQKRDFIYVKDAVSRTIAFREYFNLNGIYNIGTGHANTWVALAGAIFKALDKPVKINFIDMPEHLKSRYQYFTEADMSKFNKQIKESDINPFSQDDGVTDYVKNYLVKERYL